MTRFISFDEEIHSVDELRYWEGGDTEYNEWINMLDECKELEMPKRNG